MPETTRAKEPCVKTDPTYRKTAMWKKSLIACVEACVRDQNVKTLSFPRTSRGRLLLPAPAVPGPDGKDGYHRRPVRFRDALPVRRDGQREARPVPGPGRPLHPALHRPALHRQRGGPARPLLQPEPPLRRSRLRVKVPFRNVPPHALGLFPDEAEVLCSPRRRPSSGTADSAYANARKYQPNATAWGRKRLFPGVALLPSLARAVDGSYFQTHLRAHANVVAGLAER